MPKIFVIAGHGAGDPGACGNGFTEAERVRALAQRIRDYGGDNVLLGDFNRDYYADGGISYLNISKDVQIVELHMDSAGVDARGGHVIIKSGFSPDMYDNALASFIGSILPGRSSKIVGRSDLANPNRAAAKGYGYRLIECGFITNATDVSIFNNKMDDIAKGILAAFGIGAGSYVPPSEPITPPNGNTTGVSNAGDDEPVFSYAVRAGGVAYPEVSNLKDYAGVIGMPITDVAIRVNKGSVKYRVHVLGEDWLGWVTGYNWTDYQNGYAGNGKPIDAIQVYYYTPSDFANKYGYRQAQYRVSPVNGDYYPWQYDTDVDPNKGLDGYAGAFGVLIDRFQLY
jgi:hypothetical protein